MPLIESLFFHAAPTKQFSEIALIPLAIKILLSLSKSMNLIGQDALEYYNKLIALYADKVRYEMVTNGNYETLFRTLFSQSSYRERVLIPEGIATMREFKNVEVRTQVLEALKQTLS